LGALPECPVSEEVAALSTPETTICGGNAGGMEITTEWQDHAARVDNGFAVVECAGSLSVTAVE
jgi:hypothetical protein